MLPITSNFLTIVVSGIGAGDSCGVGADRSGEGRISGCGGNSFGSSSSGCLGKTG